ncbi:Fic family protein [Thermodesulfobacteriota bacterium]
MKKPEQAPDWWKIFHNDQGALIESISDHARLIAKANAEYMYWDKFKYQPLPENVHAEEVWAALKLSRFMREGKNIPLKDKEGKIFHYWIPDRAQKALHFLDQNAAGQILIDEPSLQTEERQRYILKSIMEEAITSSQLEGAATTRIVAKEMLRSGRPPTDHAERMIFNNFITITKIRDHLDEDLTPALLLTFHKLISKDTLDSPDQEGRFRLEKDGDIRVYDEKNQVLHTPPPPGEINESVIRLCDFANTQDGEEFVHPVIRGILLHFWLAYLHPFADGNGRTARALFYWYMLKTKYWLFEYLSISRVMRKAAVQYYRSFLYSEIDERDTTYFIMFHLRAIKIAIDELRIYLARKQKQSREAINFLKRQPHLNHRQRSLLISALDRPERIFTFRTHIAVHGVVYQTARADLLGLHELGLLEKHKSGKKFTFTAVSDLQERLI